MAYLVIVPIMLSLPVFALVYSRYVMKKSEKLVWSK
jgi:hypothetical protein